MIADYAPIDADGHVMETDDELRKYLAPPFEGRRALTALFPSLDGWPRSTRKAPDNTSCLQKWRTFLDGSGVAGSVLYPTMGLAMAHIKDVKWAAVMARCYNDYLYGEYLQTNRSDFGVSRCCPFKILRRRRKNWNVASRI